MEKTTKEPKEKKAKKEKKFNSERTARNVKTTLKAVFPNDKDKFIVSNFVDRVEVLHFDNTACSATEINMFNIIFCTLSNLKKEQLVFSKIKRESAPAVTK
jgi:Golgi nucleoside diphosphatase